MTNPPRTVEEAKEYRYGYSGWPYDDIRCAYEVDVTAGSRQCYGDPGHGPADLYCKQHAKMLERRKG